MATRPAFIEGFQLWVNLPAADKMMPPRYQGVSDDQIPLLAVRGGALIRVIAGEVDGVRGPVEGIVTDPEYLDVTVPGGRVLRRTRPSSATPSSPT